MAIAPPVLHNPRLCLHGTHIIKAAHSFKPISQQSYNWTLNTHCEYQARKTGLEMQNIVLKLKID